MLNLSGKTRSATASSAAAAESEPKNDPPRKEQDAKHSQEAPSEPIGGGLHGNPSGVIKIAVEEVGEQGLQPFKHGELRYSNSGHVIKFLLVPAQRSFDTDAILRTVMSPELWGLTSPSLTVQAAGPRGYWPSSVEEVLDPSKKEAWGTSPEARETQFVQQTTRLCSGILKAVSESDGWMYSTLAEYCSHDHAGAICEQAVDKFYSEFPQERLTFLGGRLNTQFFIKDDLDLSMFDPAHPFKMHFPIEVDLEDYAVPVGETVKKRLLLPWLRHLVWPKGPDGKRTIGAAHVLIPHFLSHVIIFDNMTSVLSTQSMQGESPYAACHPWICRPDMELEAVLTTTLPHAAVIVGGKNKGRVLDYSAELAARGCNIIVLENTGKWADILCQSIRRLRKSKLHGQEQLKQEPEEKGQCAEEHGHVMSAGTDERKYLLFDALTDTTEKVVSRLTKTLTAIRGSESNELGFAANEKARIKEAWVLYARLDHSAQIQRTLAYSLQGAIVCIGIFTTLAIALHDDEYFATKKVYVSALSAILPLLSSLLQSLMGAFSPVSKFAHLALGAEQLKSTIYKYRARVGCYSPQSARAQVNEVLIKKGMPQGEGARTKPQGNQAQANFAAAVEAICAGALADMRDSSLKMPDAAILRRLQQMHSQHNAALDSGARQDKHQEQSTLLDELLEAHANGHAIENYSLLGAVVRENDAGYDDFGSLLTGEDYLIFRTLTLQSKYEKRTASLEKIVRFMQLFIFLCTFAAALLSIFDLKRWVPTAVSLASGASSWMEFNKYQTKLSNCNQARLQLDNLNRWWGSLSMVKRRTLVCKETLVELTEHSADAEENVWAKAQLAKKDKEEDSPA